MEAMPATTWPPWGSVAWDQAGALQASATPVANAASAECRHAGLRPLRRVVARLRLRLRLRPSSLVTQKRPSALFQSTL